MINWTDTYLFLAHITGTSYSAVLILLILYDTFMAISVRICLKRKLQNQFWRFDLVVRLMMSLIPFITSILAYIIHLTGELSPEASVLLKTVGILAFLLMASGEVASIGAYFKIKHPMMSNILTRLIDKRFSLEIEKKLTSLGLTMEDLLKEKEEERKFS